MTEYLYNNAVNIQTLIPNWKREWVMGKYIPAKTPKIKVIIRVSALFFKTCFSKIAAPMNPITLRIDSIAVACTPRYVAKTSKKIV